MSTFFEFIQYKVDELNQRRGLSGTEKAAYLSACPDCGSQCVVMPEVGHTLHLIPSVFVEEEIHLEDMDFLDLLFQKLYHETAQTMTRLVLVTDKLDYSLSSASKSSQLAGFILQVGAMVERPDLSDEDMWNLMRNSHLN